MYLVRSPLHSRATIDDDDRWIAICGISHLHCTLFGRFPRVDRRTAPMRTRSIIIRQRSNTTCLLLAWPQ